MSDIHNPSHYEHSPQNIGEIRHSTRPRLKRIPRSGKSCIGRRLILRHGPRHQCRVKIRPYLHDLTLGVPSRHPCVRVIKGEASSKNKLSALPSHAIPYHAILIIIKSPNITIIHDRLHMNLLRREYSLLINPFNLTPSTHPNSSQTYGASSAS